MIAISDFLPNKCHAGGIIAPGQIEIERRAATVLGST